MNEEKILPGSLGTALIAPCGMDCGLCRGHLRGKRPCPGCGGDDSAKPGYCLRCAIRNCTSIKGIEISFCGDCSEFPCARLRQLDKRYRTKYGMSMVDNLTRIRESGLEEFVAAEKVKWACPECGGLLCVHLPDCRHCGRTWYPSGTDRG